MFHSYYKNKVEKGELTLLNQDCRYLRVRRPRPKDKRKYLVRIQMALVVDRDSRMLDLERALVKILTSNEIGGTKLAGPAPRGQLECDAQRLLNALNPKGKGKGKAY